MKIYVQVPITGRALDEARKEAAELAAMVREDGHEAVTPFDLGIAEDATSQQALPRCIEALLACDALLLHPANVNRTTDKDLPSRGCMVEALTAMTYHLGIYVVEDGAIRRANGPEITETPMPLIMDYTESFLLIRVYGTKEREGNKFRGSGSCVGKTLDLALQLGLAARKDKSTRGIVQLSYNISKDGTNN